MSVFTAALAVLLPLGLVRSAAAAPDYPPRLQAAIATLFPTAMSCVPQCTACHLTNMGGANMLNVFGKNLETYGGLAGIPNDPNFAAEIKAYFDKVAAAKGTGMQPTGDSDGDGVSDEDEIIAGDSPSEVAPRGQGQFCPDIKYGCAGGRIAPAAPPVDRVSLFSAVFVVLGFAAMRRRRRRAQRAG